NRVRAELLPLLARRFNPAIVDVLADQADLARDAWTWMEREAAVLASRVVRVRESRRQEAVRELDVARLAAPPGPLQRLGCWRGLRGGARGGARALPPFRSAPRPPPPPPRPRS